MLACARFGLDLASPVKIFQPSRRNFFGNWLTGDPRGVQCFRGSSKTASGHGSRQTPLKRVPTNIPGLPALFGGRASGFCARKFSSLGKILWSREARPREGIHPSRKNFHFSFPSRKALIYSLQYSSISRSARDALKIDIASLSSGSSIAASRPACTAIARNVEFMSRLFGRP